MSYNFTFNSDSILHARTTLMIQQKLNELPTNASLFPSTLKEKQNKINLDYIHIIPGYEYQLCHLFACNFEQIIISQRTLVYSF